MIFFEGLGIIIAFIGLIALIIFVTMNDFFFH